MSLHNHLGPKAPFLHFVYLENLQRWKMSGKRTITKIYTKLTAKLIIKIIRLLKALIALSLPAATFHRLLQVLLILDCCQSNTSFCFIMLEKGSKHLSWIISLIVFEDSRFSTFQHSLDFCHSYNFCCPS